MSIRTINRVWEYSKVGGSELLVLLCIADFTNDEGVAWPSIPTIARKSKLSKRQTIRVIQKLDEVNELAIERGAGPNGTHLYTVLSGTEWEISDVKVCFMCGVTDKADEEVVLPIRDIDSAPLVCLSCHKKIARLNWGGDIAMSPDKLTPPDKRAEGVTFEAEGVTPMSPDPSLDPSLDPKISAPKPKRKKREPSSTHKLLQGTMTKSESNVVRSPIAEYIGQKMGSPVPGGQCNKLAMGFTEHTTSGPVRHPSPDVLWNRKEPGFREYVEEQTIYFRGTGGSTAQRRIKLVNRICSYKAGGHGWLDRKEKLGPDKRQWVDV